MSWLADHPDLIAHAAGRTPAGALAATVAHLGDCPDCREELAAIESMRDSLRAIGGAAHPRVEDLVALAEGRLAGGRTARAGIEAHRAACADCRADRDALRRAATTRADRGAIRGAVAASVAIAVVAIGGYAWRRAATPPVPAAGLPTIVVAAPTRGAATPRALPAGRRVRLAIALPFGAPPGRYRARLVSEPVDAAGPGTTRDLGVGIPDDEGLVRFVLDVPATPGRYRLTLVTAESGGGAEGAAQAAVYPVLVEGEPAAPSSGE